MQIYPTPDQSIRTTFVVFDVTSRDLFNRGTLIVQRSDLRSSHPTHLSNQSKQGADMGGLRKVFLGFALAAAVLAAAAPVAGAAAATVTTAYAFDGTTGMSPRNGNL